tara:strand:- start:6132 stop:6329 length:198 start_codon:yes stop_codon:yes gene_type:complete
MSNWIEHKSTVKSFKYGEDPELIHVIKTGFKDRYMVVHEDAYDLHTGKVFQGSKAEIEEKFKIKL